MREPDPRRKEQGSFRPQEPEERVQSGRHGASSRGFECGPIPITRRCDHRFRLVVLGWGADRIGRPARSAGARRRADGELRAGRDARVPGPFRAVGRTRTSAVPAGGSEKTGLAKSPKRRRRTSTGARPGTMTSPAAGSWRSTLAARRAGCARTVPRAAGGLDPRRRAHRQAARPWSGWRHADRSGSHRERTEQRRIGVLALPLRAAPRASTVAAVSRTCRSARSRPPPSAEVPTWDRSRTRAPRGRGQAPARSGWTPGAARRS